MDFTWDAGKAERNERKHGVSFAEAKTAFGDNLAITSRDEVHDDRLLLIGVSEPGRLLMVVHVEIEDDLIRIISARKATTHERRRYEEGE